MTAARPQRIEPARTSLFVPAHGADRFANAAAGPADVFDFDVEYVVGGDGDEARENIRCRLLARGGGGPVQINGTNSRWARFSEGQRS